MSLQLLVIFVPFLMAFMAFSLDLGRLWLIRGELNQAASAMAAAAASQMAGARSTTQELMDRAAAQAVNETSGNKFNFGSAVIPTTRISCFSTLEAASADAEEGDTDCGSSPVFVKAIADVDAPQIFASLMPGETRLKRVRSYAIAGMSAPLCTACGIEPLALAAQNAEDTADFGFGDPAGGSVFTLYFSCNATQTNPVPGTLPGATAGAIPYVVINRFDANGALDDGHQLFRSAAAGLAGPTDATAANPTQSPVPFACVGVNDTSEGIWPTAIPGTCGATRAGVVAAAVCGLDARFEDTSTITACSAYADLAPLFTPDSDTTNGLDAYSSYTGNGRRIITVAVVQPPLATGAGGAMTVLGFRQFLLEPAPDATTFIDPGDIYGRFNAMYIGSPKPIPQGWFDDRFGLSCPVGAFSGPGKVVLHQ